MCQHSPVESGGGHGVLSVCEREEMQGMLRPAYSERSRMLLRKRAGTMGKERDRQRRHKLKKQMEFELWGQQELKQTQRGN